MRFGYVMAAAAACIVSVPAEAALIEITGTALGTGDIQSFYGPYQPYYGPLEANFHIVFDSETMRCDASISCSVSEIDGKLRLFEVSGAGSRLRVVEVFFATPLLDLLNGPAEFTGNYSFAYDQGSSLSGVSASGTGAFRSRVLAEPTRLMLSVVLAPVPEPATWAMMIAGFGLVGGAMRRREMAAATV